MVWVIDKESSFLSIARPPVHPVLWLTQISAVMRGSVLGELSGQRCFQPGLKVGQAVSCLEVGYLLLCLYNRQERNSCQGEGGLTPLSRGLAAGSSRVDNSAVSHKTPIPCCVTPQVAGVTFTEPVTLQDACWSPSQNNSSVLVCSK